MQSRCLRPAWGLRAAWSPAAVTLRAQDVAERGWGLRCAGYFVTGGTDHQLYSDPQNTAEFNPRTGSAVLANEQARRGPAHSS